MQTSVYTNDVISFKKSFKISKNFQKNFQTIRTLAIISSLDCKMIIIWKILNENLWISSIYTTRKKNSLVFLIVDIDVDSYIFQNFPLFTLSNKEFSYYVKVYFGKLRVYFLTEFWVSKLQTYCWITLDKKLLF